MSGINFGVPRDEARVTNEIDKGGSEVMANETTYVNHATAENNGAAVDEAQSNGAATEQETSAPVHTLDDSEIKEWLESLDSVLESSGAEVATEILERLRAHATVSGIDLPFTANTPYANTILPYTI